MKKHKLLLQLFIAGLFVSCAPRHVQQISWKQSTELENEVLKNFDRTAQIAYELANDAEYLYLKVLVNDEATQRQMMMSGMEVWIDTTKKYKENFGLHYPLRGKRPQNGGRPQNGEAPQVSEMRQAYIFSQNQFKATNLEGIKNGINPINNDNGLIVELAFDDNGSLIYNAKIPLSCMFINDISAVDSSRLFALTIKIPGVELPSRPAGEGQGGPPGGGGRPGGGRSGGGGRPGGGSGGQRPQGQPGMSDLSMDKEVKLRFQLKLEK